MKSNDALANECFRLFLEQHLELNAQNLPALSQLLTGEKKIYSQIAIHFTIQFMTDELALKRRK